VTVVTAPERLFGSRPGANKAFIWTAVTAVGTVLAGLALPLAFVQLRE
jgi:hypothetical protein